MNGRARALVTVISLLSAANLAERWLLAETCRPEISAKR